MSSRALRCPARHVPLTRGIAGRGTSGDQHARSPGRTAGRRPAGAGRTGPAGQVYGRPSATDLRPPASPDRGFRAAGSSRPRTSAISRVRGSLACTDSRSDTGRSNRRTTRTTPMPVAVPGPPRRASVTISIQDSPRRRASRQQQSDARRGAQRNDRRGRRHTGSSKRRPPGARPTRLRPNAHPASTDMPPRHRHRHRSRSTAARHRRRSPPTACEQRLARRASPTPARREASAAADAGRNGHGASGRQWPVGQRVRTWRLWRRRLRRRDLWHAPRRPESRRFDGVARNGVDAEPGARIRRARRARLRPGRTGRAAASQDAPVNGGQINSNQVNGGQVNGNATAAARRRRLLPARPAGGVYGTPRVYGSPRPTPDDDAGDPTPALTIGASRTLRRSIGPSQTGLRRSAASPPASTIPSGTAPAHRDQRATHRRDRSATCPAGRWPTCRVDRPPATASAGPVTR